MVYSCSSRKAASLRQQNRTTEVCDGRAEQECGPILRELAGGGGLKGRRPNGFLGLSLNDRTILFLVILVDKTVSVG